MNININNDFNGHVKNYCSCETFYRLSHTHTQVQNHHKNIYFILQYNFIFAFCSLYLNFYALFSKWTKKKKKKLVRKFWQLINSYVIFSATQQIIINDKCFKPIQLLIRSLFSTHFFVFSHLNISYFLYTTVPSATTTTTNMTMIINDFLLRCIFFLFCTL